MTTGAFWNLGNPAKPFGLFDPNAELVLPIYVDDWFVGMGSSYLSHEILAPSPLECVDPGAYIAVVIPMRMQLLAGADYVAGLKYPFTIRVESADGQRDDRTLYLKIVER